jgi:hypothetical protein
LVQLPGLTTFQNTCNSGMVNLAFSEQWFSRLKEFEAVVVGFPPKQAAYLEKCSLRVWGNVDSRDVFAYVKWASRQPRLRRFDLENALHLHSPITSGHDWTGQLLKLTELRVHLSDQNLSWNRDTSTLVYRESKQQDWKDDMMQTSLLCLAVDGGFATVSLDYDDERDFGARDWTRRATSSCRHLTLSRVIGYDLHSISWAQVETLIWNIYEEDMDDPVQSAWEEWLRKRSKEAPLLKTINFVRPSSGKQRPDADLSLGP